MEKRGNTIFNYATSNSSKERIGISNLDNIAFNIASFENEKQMKKYLKKLGVRAIDRNLYSSFESRGTDYDIKDDKVSFWDKKDLPRGVKKLKALSNGSIVNCYFLRDEKNKEIIIFRPNPNAKKVYHPLSAKKHIKFQLKNGVY